MAGIHDTFTTGAAAKAEAGPSQRELTPRALATGLILGALLAPCNVYSGLKIGWSFNMSITALLLAFAFWAPVSKLFGRPSWGMLESNINQTTASAAAAITSSGLVAPIPALAVLTGGNMPWGTLTVWVFSVSFLGVWIGWFLRPRLIEKSELVFPAGMATAQTMRDMFAHKDEAMGRVKVLMSSLVGAVLFNVVDKLVWHLPRVGPSLTASKLTFVFDPSLLLLGFGGIIGLRAGLGLLVGAIVAWGLIGPALIDRGIVAVSSGETNWFEPLVGWLLWPGVTLMVAASLTSFGASLIESTKPHPHRPAHAHAPESGWLQFAGFVAAAALAIVLQIVLFDVHWTMALASIPVAFALATVAARVVGETSVAPIGAIGKVSQLTFGVMAPGQPVTNLMTANVAGGAAGQSADLLNDFRAGYEVGAHPTRQVVAQCAGIVVGSLVSSLVYLMLIPDPATQLFTPEWPAPAVAVWKAVAEALSDGLGGIAPSALAAMGVGAVLGVGLALVERQLDPKHLLIVPSGATLGLAFVIPASTSLMLFAGAALAALAHRFAPNWSARFLLSVAAGLVAGESLFGVASVWF
ncbi:peptide transporter [Methyloceanibacter methanicus]|uniref:Peptide transporter n=1 Tax=Methyloceanibacter methanicus TaxID=1774968 RepID=A0A1E3VXV9_9HYPH|nr:OPT family oligopeptide transporter [Methyloceanibacter methanicus]ODR98377.1 peptide transporter [Methyloceanibacter methanicus]